MEDKDEVRQLRAEIAGLEAELRAQAARLQHIQQRLHQLDPAALKSNGSHKKTEAAGSLENFIGLKLIHLVGIVVLVIGLSIGVKYAFDRNLISVLARIILAYAAGVVLFLLSWRLKTRYGLFSAILFSGSMASFYFTSYAAHVYYGLLPLYGAFGFMVLLTFWTAFQAIQYNHMEIALLGLVGAYGIPFLISRNAERADLFFLYILIINGGVLYLRLKKGWPIVGRTAQVLTWILFIGWSATRFRPDGQFTAALFLGCFFLLFTLMEFAGKLKTSLLSRNVAHLQLLNNISFFLAGIFLFASTFKQDQLAAVALGCALLAGVQTVLSRRLFALNTYLFQTQFFLALLFLVLALAWQFSGLEVTFMWLFLSVGLFAAGMWLRAKIWRMASLALMALTLLKLLLIDSQRFSAAQKVAAFLSLGLLLLVVSFLYQKFRQRWFDEE